MTKFKFLTGDTNWLDYGSKWVSKKLNNGEFDYWLVIEILNMDDACGRDNEGKDKYNVSLSCVSPGEAGAENIAKAKECCGYEDGTLTLTDIGLVEMLSSYGVAAHLWQADGNNAHKLLKEAKKEANIVSSFTFGFSMDKATNRVGTTGWQAIKGQLWKTSPTPI